MDFPFAIGPRTEIAVRFRGVAPICSDEKRNIRAFRESSLLHLFRIAINDEHTVSLRYIYGITSEQRKSITLSQYIPWAVHKPIFANV